MMARWMSVGAVLVMTGLWCAGTESLSRAQVPGEGGGEAITPYDYERPPEGQMVPDTSVPPNTEALSEEELKRAEALLPLLEGKQEYWAIGEFVHLGLPVVPVLVKALTMPGPRIRYNAIETLSILKAASAVPALLNTAKQPNEMPRIREHALRVSVRLDPSQTVEAIAVMAKDMNSSVRKSAAFEARYVREKDVVDVLIELLVDDERFVSISALQSLWILTRHETEMHDWDSSTKQQREEWAQEWRDWWKQEKDSFSLPVPRSPRTSSTRHDKAWDRSLAERKIAVLYQQQYGLS
ncbi:HEAT repeat domain-containing protein [Nitrospira tepida]|nr:HEAT repeat domain-containing protein [Nitrospira tepida]